MFSLYVLSESLSNGYPYFTLNALTVFAIINAIFTIISKNPIISILFLIGLFGSISTYLIIIGLSFIGLSYLIVYIGAVSILFLFILMLINIRVSELQSNTRNSITLAIIITIFFNRILTQGLPYNLIFFNKYTMFTVKIFTSDKLLNNYYLDIYPNKPDLIFVTSKSWDSNLFENDHITSIGNILYTNYNIWLIITSLILLLAMIGAIIITMKPKTD